MDRDTDTVIALCTSIPGQSNKYDFDIITVILKQNWIQFLFVVKATTPTKMANIKKFYPQIHITLHFLSVSNKSN